MPSAFQLTFAGVPFCLDAASLVRAEPTPRTAGTGMYSEDDGYLTRFQPLPDFIDELDRMIPFRYREDFAYHPDVFDPALSGMAHPKGLRNPADVRAMIGEFYYPPTASRWSIFRGLATSSQVARMRAATGGFVSPATFTISSVPVYSRTPTDYVVSTSMRMLPPACVGETQGTADGLYLVTLVDERFFFGGTTATLSGDSLASWAAVLNTLSVALGITLTADPTIPAAYERPCHDSQFWTSRQEAATLLDAAAANLGCTFVRSLGGAYSLVRHATSSTTARTNAAKFNLRTAGGDYYQSGGGMPAGSLWTSRNPVTPAAVDVVFPYYVGGNDPVPHFLNPRYTTNRPTSLHEESLPTTYTLTVPVTSGGSFVSGVTGVGRETVHVEGRAVLPSEYLLGSPSNASGLLSLATAVAQDRYAYVGGTSLDVVAPGTLALLMDGTHDVVWTYSARKKQATTRLVRCPWTATVDRMQHDAPFTSGLPSDRVGAGGGSVAQTHTAKPYPVNTALVSGQVVTSGVTPITATTRGTCASGDMTIDLRRVDYLPTNYRWKGTVNDEVMIFEGTSGGATLSYSTVGIVQRGIDGSTPETHVSGSTVIMVPGAAVYGVNLVEAGPMQFVHPGEWRSGGIQGAVKAPQTQTVQVLSASGVQLNGVWHYSGMVNGYNPTTVSGLQYSADGMVWVTERSHWPVFSGCRYDGQLIGYSAVGFGTGSFSGDVTKPTAPVYAVDENQTQAIVRLTGITSTDGVYLDGFVQSWNPVNRQWYDGERVWVIDANS